MNCRLFRTFAFLLGGALAAQDPLELTIGVRGLARGAIDQGQPLFVAIRLETRPGAAPVRLQPVTGTWADALRVELVRDGQVVRRAKAPGAPAGPTAVLDDAQVAEGLLLFPSAELADVAAGDYQVRATLQIEGGQGWQGRVDSEPVSLRIEPPSQEPARRSRRALALAQEALAAGDRARAATALDAQLAGNPDDLDLLIARARLCLDAGDLAAAAVCARRGSTVESRQQRTHPVTALREVQEALFAAQAALRAGGARKPVPAWTRLPPAVVSLPGRDTPASATPASPDTTRATPVAPTAPAPQQPPAATAGPGSLVPTGELAEAAILADPLGQWAASATAGSQYGKTQYSAAKATGAPDVAKAGNSPDAWCPAAKDKGTDWLELTFTVPVHATEVRVRQNDCPGAIVKVEAIDEASASHTWWAGRDPHRAGARDIVWFAVRVPKTGYRVACIRLTLDLTAVPGWKEIDAVQIVGTPR